MSSSKKPILKIGSPKDAQTRNGSKVFIFKDFNSKTLEHDLALVKLNVKFDDNFL
jgi:hypothetical protein